MNRYDFQKLADTRLKEAKALLDSKCYDGAYYLLGYVIECALKACIAKQTIADEFPNKELANKVYTHDLSTLLAYSGLQIDFERESKVNRNFATNWSVVQMWKESARYELGVSEPTAQQFYLAVTDSTNGILQWLQKSW